MEGLKLNANQSYTEVKQLKLRLVGQSQVSLDDLLEKH